MILQNAIESSQFYRGKTGPSHEDSSSAWASPISTSASRNTTDIVRRTLSPRTHVRPPIDRSLATSQNSKLRTQNSLSHPTSVQTHRQVPLDAATRRRIRQHELKPILRTAFQFWLPYLRAAKYIERTFDIIVMAMTLTVRHINPGLSMNSVSCVVLEKTSRPAIHFNTGSTT